MGKTSARLLIATSLIAGPGFGRSALNASAASRGFIHPPVLNRAANNVGCFDTSPHNASFVTVARDVRLEVLDWGGTGKTMVLLTGLGDNGHAYDELAYQFTDRFHVIGITRRGYGRSSQPPQGYDLSTRVRDDIAVLDTLRIRQAVFVGHSVAGTELNRIAADYPDRVTKLVYLDALDLGSGGWAALPQPPVAPDMAPPQFRTAYYWSLDPAKQAAFDRSVAALSKWVDSAIQRFRSQVKDSRVVELHDTNHYVYVVDEALVVREMRKFLLQN